MNPRELEQRYSFEVYPKRDLCIVRGQGALLFDDNGKAFIDCAAGVGVANVGHAHPHLAHAIEMQARTLINCPGILYNDVRARLMEKLVSLAPAGLTRVFLCNSGTESVEAAIKFARHTTGRTGFICAMRGFHGRTMGALSATYRYRDAFEPALGGFDFVPLNKIGKIADAVDDRTAAVLVELVQGEGGVRVADRGYVDEVRALCSERGALLIVDEVQTGFGRTGAMFACDHYGLAPDLMCVAKAVAGGVPMGAVLCGERIRAEVGIHGSTFGGNPLASAAALATIEIIEAEELCNHAQAMGDKLGPLIEGLDAPVIREVRRLGLMIGIELKEKARPYIEALLDEGIIALPAGPTVIRLLPPLVITAGQVDAVAEAFSRVFEAA